MHLPVYYFQKPHSCWGVLKRRFGIFTQDVKENWFVVNCDPESERKRRQAAMRPKAAKYLMMDGNLGQSATVVTGNSL